MKKQIQRLSWNLFMSMNDNARLSFECLSKVFFHRTFLRKETILHSNPNNPGLECEPVFSEKENCNIGFQAKFFESKTNYRSIIDSIRKIKEYYADKVDKVFLFCNRDIDINCNSFKVIVDELNASSIAIVPITGQSYLDSIAEHSDLVYRFFGELNLDVSWCREQLEKSICNLNKRYNAEFSIETETEEKISFFLRNDNGCKIINSRKAECLNILDEIYYDLPEESFVDYKLISESIGMIEDIHCDTFEQCFKWKEIFASDVSENLDNIDKLTKEYEKKEINNSSEFKRLKALKQLRDIGNYLEMNDLDVSSFANAKGVILRGDMGTGKSHLLARSAKNLVDNGNAVILLLGNTFTEKLNIGKQILEYLEITDGISFIEFLKILDDIGLEKNTFSYIFIDALNECPEICLWKNELNLLIKRLNEFNNLKFIFSFRSGYEKFLPIDADYNRINKIVLIEHVGFKSCSIDSIFNFLSYNSMPCDPCIVLQEKSYNPLFLTWYCKIKQSSDKSIDELIDCILEKADEEASEFAGNVERYEALESILTEMICFRENDPKKSICKEDFLNLAAWNTYGINNKTAYLSSLKRSGIINSNLYDDVELLYIGYNFLEDYLFAKKQVNLHGKKAEIIEFCSRLYSLETCYLSLNRVVMICFIYARKFNEEIIEDILDAISFSNGEKSVLAKEYIKSFSWRDKSIPLDKYIKFANKYAVGIKAFLTTFIENATIISSELNADGLSKYLKRLSLSYRDYIWTCYINCFDDSHLYNLIIFISEGERLEGLSDKRIYLLLTLFTWMLSSSNRKIRDKTSKAMIELLRSRLLIGLKLLKNFNDINDPYIIQRLYGVVYGACVKRIGMQKETFADIVDFVYKNVFCKDEVYQDILLRDYARLIVERFHAEFPMEFRNQNLSLIRPPYKSLPVMFDVEYNFDSKLCNSDCAKILLHSMQIDDHRHLYGDFGRYVFQSAISNFQGVDINKIHDYALYLIFGELGYSQEYFEKFDGTLITSIKQTKPWLERIGKKYEWIAFYKILANVSDHYDLKDSKTIHYEGPWVPFVRDFDPSLNIIHKNQGNNKIPRFDSRYDDSCFIGANSSEDEIEKWLNSNKVYKEIENNFIVRDSSEKQWITLYCYSEYEFKN